MIIDKKITIVIGHDDLDIYTVSVEYQDSEGIKELSLKYTKKLKEVYSKDFERDIDIILTKNIIDELLNKNIEIIEGE